MWQKRNHQDPCYKQFRSDVLKRDKHTCQMCKSKNRKNLEVHHILTWAKASSLRYDPSNGICLCKTCHKSITGSESIYQNLFSMIVEKNEKRKRKK